MSSPESLTVVITGCSPGGMGAALAIAFHNAGHHVYATARNPTKLSLLADLGIETLTLDVTSPSSITAAVSAVTASLPPAKNLDILINNAAGNYTMPLADVTLASARELFDLNVWAQLAVTQALLPLLLRAPSSPSTRTFPPLIVNHTSVGSVAALPFQGVYNASKAAFAMISSTLRMELAPLGVRVVELKTAGVRTNIISNSNFNNPDSEERLPQGSVYEPAREVVERFMSQQAFADQGMEPEAWAREVVGLLLGRNPPGVIWKGEGALLARAASSLPCGLMDTVVERMTGMGEVEEAMKKGQKLRGG